ncbi:MAG: polyamine aminopropyltransferase [Pseudomonadota bacterium]
MTKTNIITIDGGEWFHENWDGAAGGLFRINKKLYSDQSAHQNILVFENDMFGRMLAIDNVIQVAERDEFIYHEMITHAPILAHGAAKRILIVGGGDGGAIREVFRHNSVEHVTMVEIDPDVVDFCKKWMPMVSDGSFDDPRLNLIIGDGAKYVAATDDRFDVVIVDSTDPVGPGAVLFTEEFYRNCKRVMKDGAVLVTQSGLPFVQRKEFTEAFSHLSGIFDYASAYQIVVPGFWGCPMLLGFASDEKARFSVSHETLRGRLNEAGFSARYYTPAHHKSAFHLAGYLRDMIPHTEKLIAEGLLDD